jgi:hypothetical protein
MLNPVMYCLNWLKWGIGYTYLVSLRCMRFGNVEGWVLHLVCELTRSFHIVLSSLCVSYRCSVPVCVVLVYTLCTKSMEKIRIVEICIRAVIMFLVCTIYLRGFFLDLELMLVILYAVNVITEVWNWVSDVDVKHRIPNLNSSLGRMIILTSWSLPMWWFLPRGRSHHIWCGLRVSGLLLLTIKFHSQRLWVYQFWAVVA